MNGVSVTPRSLGLIQKGDIGLRYIGLDVLQTDTHRTHGNGQVFEAGEKVEEVVRGEGQFRGFDILRGELYCPER
jgi:hypothetical protein